MTELPARPSIGNMRFHLVCVVIACTAATALAQGPVNVTVAPVERRAMAITQPLVAAVTPVTRTTVACEQEGIVEQRMFDEGQQVEKGAVLTRVNTDLLQTQLDAAIAAQRTTEAELLAARAEQENSQREVDRLTQLYESRVAPEKEYRDAITMRDIAAAAVATRSARIAERSAEVKRLQTMLKKAETHAPLSGVIAKRYVEVGEWIDKGAAVADLLQLDPLFVEMDVPEDVVARVRKGDPAQVEIDALGRRSFVGKVDQILPQADAASRTFRVKILLPNSDLTVWPGFFARAALTSKSEQQQFLVPKDAIVTRETSCHVVAVRDGKSAIVPVTPGRSEGDRTSVSGELKQDELVVIRGNESLHGGEMLIVMNPPTTRP